LSEVSEVDWSASVPLAILRARTIETASEDACAPVTQGIQALRDLNAQAGATS